jgi:hypothetical protein
LTALGEIRLLDGPTFVGVNSFSPPHQAGRLPSFGGGKGFGAGEPINNPHFSEVLS